MRFKFFISIFCVIVYTHLNAQDAPVEKTYLGLNSNLALLDVGGLQSDLGLLFEKGKNEVQVGMLIDYNVDPGSSKNAIGFDGSYRFIPESRSKKANFYFLYEIKFEKYGYHYSFIGLPSGTATKTITNFDHFIGYGCDYKLFNNFFLSSSIEIGAYQATQKIVYDNNIHPPYRTQDIYYGIFMIKAGFTYIFKKG